jgi:hypothetical protein
MRKFRLIGTEMKEQRWLRGQKRKGAEGGDLGQEEKGKL